MLFRILANIRMSLLKGRGPARLVGIATESSSLHLRYKQLVVYIFLNYPLLDDQLINTIRSVVFRNVYFQLSYSL